MRELSKALYDKLTGGTALTALLAGTTSVYDSVAPSDASFDYAIFFKQAGGDENMTPRRSKNYLYTVKGISKTSAKRAADIDHEIDDLLHGVTLTVTDDWTNFWCAREGDIDYVETTPDGRNIWHAGGMYRVRICK